MPERIDWYITRVRYNREHTHIDTVVARQNLGTTLGPDQYFARSEVVRRIEDLRQVIYTAPPDNKGGLMLGAKVEVVVIDWEKFLKTDPNRIKRDNLENLPEF